MKALSKFLLALLMPLWAAAPGHAADDTSYRLSAGDEISITVFNEPDLSISEIRVSATGTIAMPLLGQVAIAASTVEEVEQKLTALLLDGYLKKPNVTVHITEYRPFYINGQVRSPGSYPYRDGLTVEQAVTLAGGFTERAAKSKITLARENDVETKQGASLSDHVEPGDVITIAESFF